MRATELVHPVSMAPKSTFVLYSLVGEQLEPIQESKPQQGPDTNWNAFALPLPPAGGRVTLEDVQNAFPLGRSFHFAFRCEDGAYLDLTNPQSAVPFCGRKILARITPLEEEPGVEYMCYEEAAPVQPPAPVPAVAKLRAESYGSSTTERRSNRADDYEEFESTTYESQGERRWGLFVVCVEVFLLRFSFLLKMKKLLRRLWRARRPVTSCEKNQRMAGTAAATRTAGSSTNGTTRGVQVHASRPSGRRRARMRRRT
jgi:hypothetical protein